jgi:hypothetical protein
MKQPINLEETPGRIVGRRTGVTAPLAVAPRDVADAQQWRKVFGGLRVPRGVHRFATHEAADEWLWKMITRRRPN